MKPLLVVSILALISTPLACTPRERPGKLSAADLAAMAESARATAERVRDLTLPDDGFTEAIASKAEIANYLDARFDETDANTLIKNAGRTLEDLGALRPGTDLVAVMKRVTRDQVAGYYDWEKKTLYLADWMPRLLQEPVLVHETTHALQDAHFGLARFMKPIEGADDAQAAIQAVIEGDATLVMMEASMPKTSEAGRELAYAMMLSAAEQQVDAIDAPRVVSEALLFPYTGGLKLVRAVKKHGGWSAVNAMYTDVPLSTEQVLHPEKYLETPRDLPQRVTVKIPAALSEAGWTPAFRGPQGELGLRTVLRESLGLEAASAAAAGWGGDETVLLEKRAGGPTLTLLGSVWDDEAEAEAAEAALKQTKTPPQAIVRAGVRVAGVWGEPVPDAETIAREVARGLEAREAATFDALVGEAP